MLTALVRFSLRFRGVIVALTIAALGYGGYTISQAKYDVFPEFAPPQVVIQTEAPGLAPEQVELLVTQPIENLINGMEGIESLRSGSIQGLSVITVTFEPGSDVAHDRQVVTERLASLAGQLPQGVEAPVMTPLTSSTGDLLTVGLTSKKLTLMELRTLADWTVQRRLLAVPGVAKVAIFGGEVKQLQVQVLPERLIQYNLSLEDVLAAARRATGIRGAGFIDTSNQRIVLQTEGQAVSTEQLAGTMLTQASGVNVPLGNVARIVEAPEPPISDATIMGEPGVILNVWEQYGANTLEVTQRIEEALRELKPTLDEQKVVMTPDLFRPANFIQEAVKNVQSSLLIGAGLVVVVLFLFLFNLRAAAISCTAIPLSLMMGISVLQYLGHGLNTMTLGGLAIAIGMVVDDAVIDVENILRRLRLNRALDRPVSIFRVVLDASLEVRGAVVYATLAVALVFIPILTMSGLAGRLFAPLGIAYIAATLASLLVALTVTPALGMIFLGRQRLGEKDPPLLRVLKRIYIGILAQVEGAPALVIGFAVLFMAGGMSTIGFMGMNFLPELREGHFLVHVNALPGTSLDQSRQLGRQITTELLSLPFIRSVAQRIGRAAADDTFGTHSSEFEVDLKPLEGEQAEAAQEEIRKALSHFPGVSVSVNTFLAERVEETISGFTSSVVVHIYGDNLEALEHKGEEAASILGKVKGAADVEVKSPAGAPQVAVRLRKEELNRWRFDAVDVLEAVRTAYQGEVVGQSYEGNKVFGVSVILDPQERRTVSQIQELPLRNAAGTYVRLRQLADVFQTSGRYEIQHEGARRVQTVTCNVEGRPISEFVADAQRQIRAAVTPPPGGYVEFTGDYQAQARSTQDLWRHSLLAGLGIVILLSIVLGHARNLILILVNLPMALVGGVLAVYATGGEPSIGSLVGFVTLFGITLRNSIMMISHYEHMVTVEGAEWGAETAIRGASERLAPILITSLVTALGLLPLALGSGEAGREIEGPMALVILGGLATSTVLNLIVLPALALRFGRFVKSDPEAD